MEIEFPSHLLQHPLTVLVLAVRLEHELHREGPAWPRRDEGNRCAMLAELTVRNHDMFIVRIDDTFKPRAAQVRSDPLYPTQRSALLMQTRFM